MGYHEHKQHSIANVACAVLTTSDSRTEQDDESGKLIKQRLTDSGHKVAYYAILKNDSEAIKLKIEELLRRDDIQVIITGGGTGLSKRDVTVNTITPMLEKKLEGFGELFRQLTYQEIGTGSIMSRAIAGVTNGKVIICIPGSLGAATLAMDKIILPEIGHLVREATR
ncbi:MAG TPA: MogA/MoaB family molybdenum cofactor biosynthesis protein [Dehalococcoidales bacterium]